MKNRAILVLGIIIGICSVAAAQTTTVTNKDLEKYRQKRLQSERDLRENYREMGFPSPEQLEAQNRESRKELSELSQRLRESQLKREEYERRNSYQTRVVNTEQADFIDYQQYYGVTYFTNFNRHGRYHHNRRIREGRRANGIRIQGFFGNGQRNRRTTAFGPDRRLTRQNAIKSRRANRAFSTSLFYGTRQN